MEGDTIIQTVSSVFRHQSSHSHLVADDVLSGFQVPGDRESVDVIISGQNIGRSPFSRGILARLGNLEPDGTGYIIVRRRS